jgi:hypothetical protein
MAAEGKAESGDRRRADMPVRNKVWWVEWLGNWPE